jgi:hypothetical protein
MINSSHAKGKTIYYRRGCDFVTSSVVEAFNNNYTSINLLGSSYTDQTSIIIDNTFYPCSNGVYQS